MKTNFSLLFYLKRQKNYLNGNVPIYMRITVGGTRSEIPNNRECDPNRWNAKGGRAIGSREEIKLLNTHLDHLQNAVKQEQQCVYDFGRNDYFGGDFKAISLSLFRTFWQERRKQFVVLYTVYEYYLLPMV